MKTRDDINNISLYKKYPGSSFDANAKKTYEIEDYHHVIYDERYNIIIVYVWDTREIVGVHNIPYLVSREVLPKNTKCVDSNKGLKDSKKILRQRGFYGGYLALDYCDLGVTMKRAPKPTGLAKVGHKSQVTFYYRGKILGFHTSGSSLYLNMVGINQAINIKGTNEHVFNEVLMNIGQILHKFDLQLKQNWPDVKMLKERDIIKNI